MDFVPFYRLHRRTYAIYWDLFTPQEWDQRATELAAERERQRKLEAATVGFAQPGEMQAERDANMQGEDTEPVRLQGRAGRRGGKWFSFDLPVDPAHPMALVVTYNHDEWQERKFDVLVDGVRVGEQTIERRGPMRFFDVEYPVPGEPGERQAEGDGEVPGRAWQRDRHRLWPAHDPRRHRAVARPRSRNLHHISKLAHSHKRRDHWND